ncbi:cytochrome P450 71B19-like isoform X1 [Cucurbita pepo subsp. pepo]|uniref:cytochrome P450 71B19-like isoform X1 n=1 Tax=Cucurbita pepo subsp. pepo TaxID=3664 RepID=UPI000C9D3B02|nr:cytochrome P450 71B19-like isoform X1 [Cucurbita pepo subsp. pepo]
MSILHFPPGLPLLLFLSSLFIILKWKVAANRRKRNFPPSPPKLPIIGNLHQLGKLPHKSLWRLSQLYGPIMSLNLGRIETIIISSAETARALLKTHDLQSCNRPQTHAMKKFTYNFLDLGFSPYSDYWREMRKICMLEFFSMKRVLSYEPIREQEVGLLIESILQSASCGATVDLSEKSIALTTGVIFRIAFGKPFEGNGFHELISEVEALMGSYSASEFFPVPFVGEIFDWFNGRKARLEKVFNEINALFQEVINEHLCPERPKPVQDDIIDVLLAISKKQVDPCTIVINHENIKAILFNIFVAGLDTGSITIVWAMAELAKNSKLMKKAQEEIRNYVGNKGKVRERDVEELPYLKMIVKETLRLHPPAPLLLPRETISHFKIENYDFYPKTMVQVNIWAIGRDPTCWTDPEEFLPERFAESSIDYKGQHFEFLPFGAGRRICPGINMGVKTVELALTNLLYHFDWKLSNGMKEEDLDMEESSGLSLTIYKKVPLKLVPILYHP